MRVKLEIVVVALAMGLGVSAAGCGSGSSQSFGDVIMTVTVPSGVQVQSAQYTIDDKIHLPTEGVMGGQRPQQQFVELIAHVPASDAYVATVQAESVDGQMVCSGSAVVKVMNGVTSRVEVALKCGGHVLVAIGVSCRDTPLVDFLVSPLVASLGGSVIGRADSARPDGGAVTLMWSAPSGTFSDASGSETAFTCTQSGLVPITLNVEDDELCQQSYSSMVTCLGPDGGIPDGGLPLRGPADGGAAEGGPADGGVVDGGPG
jgi:hypothetical protein